MAPVTSSRRRHGFQYPFHPFQVATWLLYPLLLIQYFAFLYPLLWRNIVSTIVLTAFFGLAAVGVLFSSIIASIIDPVDDAVLNKNHNSNTTSRAGEVYCYLCDVHV